MCELVDGQTEHKDSSEAEGEAARHQAANAETLGKEEGPMVGRDGSGGMARKRRSEGEPSGGATSESVAAAADDKNMDVQSVPSGPQAGQVEEKDFPRPSLAAPEYEAPGGAGQSETTERGVAETRGGKHNPQGKLQEAEKGRLPEPERSGASTAIAPNRAFGPDPEGTEDMDVPVLRAGARQHDE